MLGLGACMCVCGGGGGEGFRLSASNVNCFYQFLNSSQID